MLVTIFILSSALAIAFYFIFRLCVTHERKLNKQQQRLEREITEIFDRMEALEQNKF